MPWCPKCREEYRPGFRICMDCDTELVDELPPPKENDEAAEMEAAWSAAEESGRRRAGMKAAGGSGRMHRESRRPAPSGDSLWCPRCGTEYRRDFKRCSDCGAELVDDPAEIAEAEIDEGDMTGEGDEQIKPFCDAYLTTVAGWAEAERIESYLNDDGIPVAKTAGGSGVDIHVPEELLEEARDIVDGVGEFAGDEERTGEEEAGSKGPAPLAAGGSGRLWCPNCRVEYWQEGVAVCSDCGARLVAPATGPGKSGRR